LLCVALSRKRSHNNIAARLAGRRQRQRLKSHRQVNLMDRPQVSLAGYLQGRA
jgi:hypothetical protein